MGTNWSRARALDNLNGVYLLIFNDHVLALCNLVTAHRIVPTVERIIAVESDVGAIAGSGN